MRLKRLTKVAAVTVAVSMFFSGCKSSDAVTDSKTQDKQDQVVQQEEKNDGKEEQNNYEITYPVSNNKDTLTFWCPITNSATKYMTSYNEHPIFQEVEKRTGIHVEFSHPALGQQKEQLNILMASDDLPDMIMINNMYNGGAATGVDEGVFMDLTKLVPEYAPDYYKRMKETELGYRLATTTNGDIVEFDMFQANAPEFTRVVILNDTIQKYEINPLPVTIEDYDQLFEKMAKDNLPGLLPASNGKIDQFLYPYGITGQYSLDENGKVQWGPYTTQYKEYLTMMNEWYTKGYIHKDFISNLSENEKNAMFLNQQVGITVQSIDTARSLAEAVGKSVTPVNYPRMFEGQEMNFQNINTVPMPLPGNSNTVITKDCKNPELAMEYLNYFYTEEGADLLNWGIKGLAYNEDENGNKVFTDYMINNPDVPAPDNISVLKMHQWPKYNEGTMCNPNVICNEAAFSLRKMYSDDTTVSNKQTLPAFQLSTEAASKRNEIMTDVNTYSDEMTLKFITGAVSLDKYDEYMSTLKSMGVEEAIQITQEEYDQFMNKPVPEDVGK